LKNSLPFFLVTVYYFFDAVIPEMDLCFGLWSRKLLFLKKKNPSKKKSSEEIVPQKLFRNWSFVSKSNGIDQNCLEIIAPTTHSVLIYQDSILNFYWNQLFSLINIWFYLRKKNWFFMKYIALKFLLIVYNEIFCIKIIYQKYFKVIKLRISLNIFRL